MVPPDGAVKETSVQGVRTGREVLYRQQADGTMHVSNPMHQKALKDLGFREAYGAPAKGGFRCKACGFGSWFKTCSRCGGECEKDK